MGPPNMTPFRVIVTYRNGNGRCQQITYNFATLGEAINRCSIDKTKQHTIRVEITMSLMEWVVRGADHEPR